MAKGLRASTNKKNNASLRAKFAPHYDARTQRLSAKLQELAAQPRPEQERAMDTEELESKNRSPATIEIKEVEGMDVDTKDVKSRPELAATGKKSRPTRTDRKIAKRKAKSSIVFAPNARQKKRLASKGKKS